MKNRGKQFLFTVVNIFFFVSAVTAQEGKQWIAFEPDEAAANGKHIVFISGDEEYRSEEALPVMAKILTEHHGFKSTVLFAIDPETGEINPDHQTNIPGLEHLQSADLMFIFTRFRELPDEQMQYIDEYIRAAKPIVALRTATHAFNYEQKPDSPYAKYSYNSSEEDWEGGFGRRILGETWIDHHGVHGEEGTRGLVDGIKEREGHPILNGVEDIWGPTDVYGTRKLTGNPDVLVWGQSTRGMTADAPVNWRKSIMPVAWTRYYTGDNGQKGRVFATTMGASVDLKSEDLRRLLLNACYWAVGLEEDIPEEANVELPGEYNPTMFGFGDYQQGLRPEDFE